jgi:hypothetical protein
MTITAIDPGKNGALATWDDETGRILAHPMPDTEGDILDLLECLAPAVIYLEQVGGFIGRPQPGSAMFNFGRNYGFLLGACAGLKIPVYLVTPQKWQKGLGLPGSGGDPKGHKNRLKAEAQRRYGKATLKTCDALLILEWARGQHGKAQV